LLVSTCTISELDSTCTSVTYLIVLINDKRLVRHRVVFLSVNLLAVKQMESPAAVIDVSTECKGVVRRDESREFDDPFSTCSASYEGSVV
jgi:hypothetical protein